MDSTKLRHLLRRQPWTFFTYLRQATVSAVHKSWLRCPDVSWAGSDPVGQQLVGKNLAVIIRLPTLSGIREFRGSRTTTRKPGVLTTAATQCIPAISGRESR